MMGVIGGIHTLWGSLLGASLLTYLPEYLRVFNEYDILIYGAILLAILLFMPEGFLEGFPTLLRKIRKARQGLSLADTLLKVDNVKKVFGGLMAIVDLSFEVKPGQIKSVIGPNSTERRLCST